MGWRDFPQRNINSLTRCLPCLPPDHLHRLPEQTSACAQPDGQEQVGYNPDRKMLLWDCKLTRALEIHIWKRGNREINTGPSYLRGEPHHGKLHAPVPQLTSEMNPRAAARPAVSWAAGLPGATGHARRSQPKLRAGQGRAGTRRVSSRAHRAPSPPAPTASWGWSRRPARRGHPAPCRGWGTARRGPSPAGARRWCAAAAGRRTGTHHRFPPPPPPWRFRVVPPSAAGWGVRRAEGAEPRSPPSPGAGGGPRGPRQAPPGRAAPCRVPAPRSGDRLSSLRNAPWWRGRGWGAEGAG